MYISQKNSHVTLKCGVILSKKQLDEAYTIKWTKSGRPYETVIETFTNKEVDIGKSFTGRVELVNGTSLKINGLQPGDAKDYQCSVYLYGKCYKTGHWNRLKING